MKAASLLHHTKQSEYMHWAKTRSDARFNLATSGLANLSLKTFLTNANLSLKDFLTSLDDLEITGTSGYGYEPLIRALAGRYQIESGCVVTAAGTSFANHLAMAALINPGDEVLFERPVYEPLLALAHYLRADVKRFDRQFEYGFRLLPAEIEKKISNHTRLIVITNFHNPSGVFTDDDTLAEVGEIARKVNARVLVDEVYVQMLFQEPPRTAFHLGHQFVVTSSLTKAFGLSGLRCGWIFAEAELAERMWRLNDLFAASPVHVGERLSVLALQQLEGISKRAQTRLNENREILNRFLDQRQDLEAIRPGAGSIMFPRVKQGDSEMLCRLLREKYETSVVPGRFFEMPAHFRIGLGEDTETMAEGLERLGAALDEVTLQNRAR